MGYCACVYSGGGSDNLPVNFWPSTPKARKEHRCYECKRAIQPGEQYHRDSGKWEESFYSFKVCLVCREITNEFFCEGFSYGRVLDDLYEHIHGNGCSISERCLAKLSPAARGYVCDLIEECWKREAEDE